tara:strand:- start:1214 stop:2587 length:1374 start_codon:yes stop_codon:yes gene_type:complete
MAQKAELKGKINLDSSGFKRGIAQSKKSVGTFVSTLKGSLLPALGAAGAAGALMGFGRRAIESASQIKELAQVSGLGVVEFQKFAEAAKTVNIEQEKLADIFKDTSDKMGDFMNTGGGAMADFFEKIAPLVGATKEEFMGLSGAESLQKYFNFLEAANIPHQEMVFYMEAIASDATMLIPLLANGGEAFKKFGEGAEEAGNIMSEETIEALDQANDEIDRFMQNVTVFVGQLLAKLRPAKDELRELAILQLKAEGVLGEDFVKKSRMPDIFGVRAMSSGLDEIVDERAKQLKEEADAAELANLANEQMALTLATIASVKEREAAATKKQADAEAKRIKITEDSDKRQADALAKINERRAALNTDADTDTDTDADTDEKGEPEAITGFQDKSSDPDYIRSLYAGMPNVEDFVKSLSRQGATPSATPSATQKNEIANTQLTVLNQMNGSLKTIEREMTR